MFDVLARRVEDGLGRVMLLIVAGDGVDIFAGVVNMVLGRSAGNDRLAADGNDRLSRHTGPGGFRLVPNAMSHGIDGVR